MAVLIDTDVLIAWKRGAGDRLETLIGEEARVISVITVSELLHGIHRGQGEAWARRRAFVEHVLAALDAVPITRAAARVHAEIWSHLSRDGRMIGAHDLWIAATALSHGFGLATGNRHEFEQVPGLRVVAVP